MAEKIRTAHQWELLIRRLMKARGLDDLTKLPVVAQTAQIAAEMELVKAEYDMDPRPVVEHTNKGGSTNLERNPLLQTWMSLQAQMLTNWRELCLTPKSYKQAMGERQKDAGAEFIAAIAALEGKTNGS